MRPSPLDLKLPLLIITAFFCGVLFVAPHAHASYAIGDNSIQGLYHLENAGDSSGNANNLQLNGSTTVASGTFSNGMQFNATGESASTSLTNASNTFGYSFWIKIPSRSTNSNPSIVKLADGSNGWLQDLGVSGSGQMYFSGHALTTSITDNAWHNVILNVTASSSGSGSWDWKLYLDGSLEKSGDESSGALTGLNYNFGNNGGNLTEPINGVMDDIVVRNTTFSSTDITSIWNSGTGNEVVVADATSSLSGLEQSETDLSTAINPGSSTTEAAVVLSATLTTDASTTLQLEAEIRPTGTSFLGTVNATSSPVASGITATTTYTTLVNGSYHWQARVKTGSGATSPWQQFGANATSTVDFIINHSTSTYAMNDSSVHGLYHMENSNDSSGYGNTLTLAGSPPSATGKFNKGIRFNTSGQAASTTYTNPSNTFGYSFWIRIPTKSTNSNPSIVMLGNSSNGWLQDLGVSGVGQMYFNGHALTHSVTDDLWHNVILNVTASSTSSHWDWKLYLDGSLEGSGGESSGALTGVNYNFGNNGGNLTEPIQGTMDDIVVLNRNFTTDDISAIWHGGLGSEVTGAITGDFYAVIQNTSTLKLYDASSTSANILKKLPAGWVIYVASSTDGSGNPMITGNIRWDRVTDPTDNIRGWMKASDTAGQYISAYDGGAQSDFIAKASSTYDSSSTRATLILQAIDDYYNNTSTVDSIYSSDDGGNSISTINDRDFPEKVLWGIAAVEDGGATHLFNNENVSFDYGHGIMQLTFNAWGFEPGDPHATFDHRGEGTGLAIPPCASLSTSTYVSCYTHGGEADTDPKQYKDYGYSNVSTTYKYYTNTYQSIYSNIKDGLRDLQNKFPVNQITTSTTPTGTTTTYSGVDREMVIATANYNGTSTYLAAVADRLENIDAYFPNQTSSDITDIINKLDLASDHSIYVQLHSPGDLSVSDSKGRTIGVVNGVVKDDFSFGSYDPETKSAKIFFPDDDDLQYKVIGTGNGVYGLDITITSGTQRIVFHQNESVPIIPGEIHTYSIDKNALLSGGKGMLRKIDKKGNGKVDETDALYATISNIALPKLLSIPNSPISRQTKFDFKQASPPIFPRSIIYQSSVATNTNSSSPPYSQISTIPRFLNASSSLLIGTSTQINASTTNQ